VTEQQGGSPDAPQPATGLQLPWVSAEPVLPSAPGAAERLRTALRRARARATVLGATARAAAARRVAARPAFPRGGGIRLPARRRLGPGARARWDARRITMVAAMGCGAVLLLLAPFLKPDAAPGDPAAATAPDGRSPLGTHGRHRPTATDSPTDQPSSASATPSESAGPTATATESTPPSPAADRTTATPTAARATPTTAPAAPAPAPSAPPAAPSTAPAQPAPAPPAPQPVFQAVAGFGCSGPGGHFQEVGAFRQGTDGWVTVNSGGDTGDSCDGRYEAVPMSGDKNKDDSSTYALWTFDVGAGPASCGVSVYVPASGSIQQVGGAPAYYTVAGASGADLGSFTVDQVGHPGSWVDAGTFRPTGGPLVVRLHNRGQDWTGSGQPTHAHIAAAPIRLTCRP
jgi:translation initiation factor IF-2